jgi:hypothetical protein
MHIMVDSRDRFFFSPKTKSFNEKKLSLPGEIGPLLRSHVDALLQKMSNQL